MSDWRERYETGTTWELKLYAYLLKLGRYAILRVAHGGMFAPVLETWYRRITAPDFQMHDMKTGDYVWPESKWKQTAARFYLANNEWRTGIDVDKYHHYRAVEEATHHSVALFFTHDREGEVRLAWLKDKIDGVGRGDRMVYWSWDRLQYVASIADVEACKPADLPVTGRTLFRPPSLQLGLDLDGDA